MRVLIDMNLSPDWAPALQEVGFEAIHWTDVGSPTATDRQIFQWAGERGFVVFTHDLDFGAILAATRARGPSVIQLRVQDVAPDRLRGLVVSILRRFESELERGVVLVFDGVKSRIRVLPLMK